MVGRVRLIGWRFAALLLLGIAGVAHAEDLTVTTAYPSPRGVYKELRTMDNTYLAVQKGNVGIGTTTPHYKVEVVSDTDATPAPPFNLGGVALLVRNSTSTLGAGLGISNTAQTAEVGAAAGPRIAYLSVGVTTPTADINLTGVDGTICIQNLDTPGCLRLAVNPTATFPVGLPVSPATIVKTAANHLGLMANNVGIGTTSPVEKLHVEGWAVVNNPTGNGLLTVSGGQANLQYAAINLNHNTGPNDTWSIRYRDTGNFTIGWVPAGGTTMELTRGPGGGGGGNVGMGNSYSPGSPVPNGVTNGNLDVNDVWVRGANPPRWASEGTTLHQDDCIQVDGSGMAVNVQCPVGRYVAGVYVNDQSTEDSNEVMITCCLP